MIINYTKQSSDGLQKEQWEFNFQVSFMTLELIAYRQFTRSSSTGIWHFDSEFLLAGKQHGFTRNQVFEGKPRTLKYQEVTVLTEVHTNIRNWLIRQVKEAKID